MKAFVITCRDPFNPGNRHSSMVVRRRKRLGNLAPKTQQPFVCNVNGHWIPRAAWNRRVRDGDVVNFILLPQGGGGGSNPIKFILMIAVAYFAPMAAGAIMPAGASAGAMAVATGVIGMVGSMLVNALIPPPKPPSASFSSVSPSPTYSLGAQGNQARIGQPIPSIYGRHIIYPDFAASPYVEYAGNEQYLYQLFCIGQGEYEIEAIRVEDTLISAFAEISYEIVAPGGAVSLFPAAVITSPEVSGQEALQGAPLGPFVANGGGSMTDTLAFDVVMSRGLYYANDDGGLNEVSVSWIAEAQLIDDFGVAIGPWFTLGEESVTDATTTPIRKSYRYAVPAGRYQARLTRRDAKLTNTRYGHELNWSGLRAYLPGMQTYGGVTLIAMRMRATNNLSSQASRKINVIATRKLPTWSPSGGWSAPSPTRNPAWAFADICRADYGGGLPSNRVDLQTLYSLAQGWNARGDYFDGIFDSQGTIMDALSQVARAGRGVAFQHGGLVRCVRDAPVSLPSAMFSSRNIERGSLRLQYLMASEETADAVEVTYFDSVTWGERTVLCILPGGTSSRPAKVKLFGVTSRAQAWREGMYMAACNRYRRRIATFGTEMEGFIPTMGDLIAVQHDMPKWGQSGDVVGWDAATKTATLSEPLDWSAGGLHSMAWRRRDGRVAGPWTAQAGPDLYHVVIPDWDTSADPTPDTGGDRERTHFAFGPANMQYILCRVLSLRPKSTERVEISAVVESDFVHVADVGAPPTDTAWQMPTRFTSPVVSGLTARSMPDFPDRMVLSWQPAAGADHYLIEQSNGGGNWTRTGETRAANYCAVALYGPSTVLRVAAVGLARGPWVEIAYGLSASYFWSGNDAQLLWTSDDTPMWMY